MLSAVRRWESLSLSLLMLVLCLCQQCFSLNGKPAAPPAINKRLSTSSSWADIELEINNYLAYKRTLNLVSPLEMADIGSYDNPLGMLAPSGWFKDNEAIDLRRRSDKRLPTEFHPLSYLELKACGFDHLIEIIIELGGPVVVGQRIGINFIEPKREYKEDESLRPVRSETFALDMRGSLKLGSSLDDRLDAAASLNLEEIKANIAARKKNTLLPEEM